MTSQSSLPLPVSELVKPADESAAIPIADRIWMSEDITNSYLLGTGDGCIVINTGSVGSGARHRSRFDDLRQGPYRMVILTQSHPDHYGGLQSFRDAGTQLVAQRGFPDGFAYRERLRPYYDPRSMRIWRAVLGDKQPKAPGFDVAPDLLVDQRQAFTVGGRGFELLSIPGGETTDSLGVWLPEDRVIFTGNLFGPAFMTVPNLNPIRCDKPRSALEYVRSANIILSLDANLLITGHGQPIRGADRIKADVTRLRDAVQYVHDATVAGMNAGKTMYELMRTITLPESLRMHESYGKVAWCVRTVWQEYTGWFNQDFTTRIYEVPQEAIVPELVALAGAKALTDAAGVHLKAGRPLEALHFIELLLIAEPANAQGLALKSEILALLLARAEPRKNLNEMMWLRSEAQATANALKK